MPALKCINFYLLYRLNESIYELVRTKGCIENESKA